MLSSKAADNLQFRTRRLVVNSLTIRTGNSGQAGYARDIADILVPAVLQHLPGPLQMPDGPDPVESWVTARQAESILYAVRQVSTDMIIGLMILADTSECDATPTLRLGYLLAQPVWGQGYASELVTGLIKALGEAGWSGQVLAGVNRANPASSRVLLKSGFVEAPDTLDPESQTFRINLA
ncbi:Acetyltransferase (GNAT) domain [Hoeflea sp. IMCC20628]|uniref:GNAT family N-acetyltransferase n=1 Tax=Hoeflea sp. IMCC20628 TaxID=1620421 RepID=UPI00063BD820|nr:GNAT family N-acetyltransferase [Hoeflea sp. IMCC20628]AKI02569.1 Acetyltransferase (GNAT) domain [Hoeflea sp. IMCC20628]